MIIDVEGIDVVYDEVILKDGELVGYVSLGGYVYYVGKLMVMGYVIIECVISGMMF